MSLVIPTGFAEAAIEWKHTSDPDPWYITFGLDLTEFGGDFAAVFIDLAQDVIDYLLPEVSSDVFFSGMRLTVGQDGDPLTLFTPVAGQDGGGTTEVLPQNCAALVSKITGLGGRKGKGRLFFPGCLDEEHVNSIGGIDGTLHSQLQGAFDNFWEILSIGRSGSNPLPMFLLHNDYGVDTPDPTRVTGLTVQTTIATQRRRLR